MKAVMRKVAKQTPAMARKSTAGPLEEHGQRAIQSIEVGGRLLLALAGHDGPMSLKALAARADLPASRAHPYLVSFGRLGLISQEATSGHYALGPAALQIGLTCLHQLDPIRAAGPVVARLAEQTGHAVTTALWGNFGPTIVRMIEARQPLLVALRAGTVMSVFGTATGRAFAAVMPESRLAEVVLGRSSPVGDEPGARPRVAAPAADALATLSGAERELVRQARRTLEQRGVVRAEGHPIPGVNAFSAPCLDGDGAPALVITMLGHRDSFPVGWDSPAADAVRQAAGEISSHLGWRPRETAAA